MRFKLAIFSILAFVLSMLSGCVYQNNKSALPETCSIKLTVKVKKNKLSNPDLAFKEYDYVKFWFFNDTKKVKSVLATKLAENNSKFDGQYVFFTQKWKGANTKIEVKTDVDADLTEEAIENYQIDGVPVDTKYIAIGIPDPDNGDSIEVQFIKMNSGELVVSDNSEKYGWQYEGLGIKWQTNLEKGKLITIGDEDNPVILTTKANKTFKAQLIPQMVGKTKIGKAYVTGPFNGWNQQDAAYEMTENEDGIYEFTFEGKAPGEFIYKFGYDGSWGDADVTGDIFVDDNNGGNNSKAIVNGESSSKFLPVISLISNKKAKGTVGAYLQPDPTVIPTHDDTWDNGGMIKVDVNTDLYITNNIDFVKLLARQKEIKNAPANANLVDIDGDGNSSILNETGEYSAHAEIEIWEANNPAIKSVNITYDGMLDLSTGNVMASSDNKFNGRLLKNEPISKFIYKKEYKSPYGDASFPNEAVKYEAAYIIEGVDIPNEAGIYQFTITAVDKYNMTAQELVYMNVVNSAPVITKTTIKTFKLGTADSYSNLVVVTAKVSDIDTNDVKSIKLDLSAVGQGVVDMLDDGKQTVSGDAKAKDSIYTYSFMAPSTIGVHTYTFPVTLTDNSDLNTISNIEFAITEAYKADGKYYTVDEKGNLIKKGGSQGVPTKLLVFDGRNEPSVTSDMKMYVMGTLTNWSTGELMTQVSDKVWVYLATAEEGTYTYKYRANGDWATQWNQDGVGTPENGNPDATTIIF